MATVYRSAGGFTEGEEAELLASDQYFGAFDYKNVYFVYEHQGMLAPQYNADTPTAQWTKGDGTAADLVVPTGVQYRGLYELVEYGVKEWIEDITGPNYEKWWNWMSGMREVQGDTSMSNPATSTAHIEFDHETVARISTNELSGGQFADFKTRTGLGDTAARQLWEYTWYSFQAGLVDVARSFSPKAPLSDMYLFPQFMYQLDPSGADGLTIQTGTGRTAYNELIHQLRGTSPSYAFGGTAGHLLHQLRLFDFASFQLYNVIGYSSLDGENVTLNGVSTPTVPPLYYPGYLRNFIRECRRAAALANKPLRFYTCPNVAVFEHGNGLPDTAMNQIDAQASVEAIAEVGGSFGVWGTRLGYDQPYHYAQFKQGLANMTPHVRRIFNPPAGPGSGD